MTSFPNNLPKNLRKYKFWNKLFSLNFVEEIILFGSRARSDNAGKSDIDLAYKLSKVNDHDIATIHDIIDNADTLLKIDYVDIDSLANDHPLRKNIIEDGLVIYQNKP